MVYFAADFSSKILQSCKQYNLGNMVIWIHRFAYLSSILIVVLLCMLFGRLSQPSLCNNHPDIQQLHLFSNGVLKKVSKCSLINKSEQVWSDIEVKMIKNALSIGTLESPILLTIDLVHKNKIQTVDNYFWVGKKYFLNNSPLFDWIKTQNLSVYKSSMETPFVTRILNSLTYKLSYKKKPEFNWSNFSYLNGSFHLTEVLNTKTDYCDKFRLNLSFYKNCNQKYSRKETLFAGGIEALIVQIISEYFNNKSFREKMSIIKNIRKHRRNWGTTTIKKDTFLEKEDYLSLAKSVEKLTKRFLMLIQPKNKIDNELFKRIVNKSLYLNHRDYLIVWAESFKASKYINNVNNHQVLHVDNKGELISSWGSPLGLKKGNIKFHKQIYVGPKIDIKNKNFKSSRYIYIIESLEDFNEIQMLGIEAFLNNNKAIKFAKIHPQSFYLSGMKSFNLSILKKHSKKLGWESEHVFPSQQGVVTPLAIYDGIVSYRDF